MGYENDFVDEKPVEINIDGRIFMYKPTTGGDENEWLKDTIIVDPETKLTKINWPAYTKHRIGNIVSVPYSDEMIKEKFSLTVGWNKLSLDEKYKLLGKMKSGLFDKLVDKMKDIDAVDEKAAKN